MPNNKAPGVTPDQQTMSDQPTRPEEPQVTQGPVTMPTPDAPRGPRDNGVVASGESDDATDPKPAEPGAKAKALVKERAGKTKITSPNTEFSGVSAGVRFIDGEGYLADDNEKYEHLIQWFKENGYTVHD